MFREAAMFYEYYIKNTVEKGSHNNKDNSILINKNFQNEDMRR